MMQPTLFLVVMISAAAPDAPSPITAAERTRLAGGEILVATRPVVGSDIPEATVRAVIDAPPEIVWSIASDCANYKTTMPSIEDSRMVSSTPATAADGALATEVRVCRVVAHLPFPFPNLVSLTRGVHVVEPGKRWQRTWHLVEGDYERNDGKWLIEPFGDDGKRALATYVIEAKPKIFLPASLIANVQQGKLPEMMRNLRTKSAAAAASVPTVPEAPAKL